MYGQEFCMKSRRRFGVKLFGEFWGWRTVLADSLVNEFQCRQKWITMGMTGGTDRAGATRETTTDGAPGSWTRKPRVCLSACHRPSCPLKALSCWLR